MRSQRDARRHPWSPPSTLLSVHDQVLRAGRLERIASAQHGLISARQLEAVGVGAKARHRAVAAGTLIEVEAAVYVVAGTADTWHQRLQAGLLAIGPHAWVSHEAAATLHDLDGPADPDVPTFPTLRARCRVRLRTGTVHTTTRCGPHDVINLDGFRASATRTVLDLAVAGGSDARLPGDHQRGSPA